MPLIALTTDFGLSDVYVGVMKGVMAGICPDARFIDITHDIAPQNLVEATVRLQEAAPYFPEGAVHLVVVDPGVGSDRRAVIVRTGRSLYVAPDNGVLTLPLQADPPVETIAVTDAAAGYVRRTVSATFHGRDIFAPLAAHVASGVPLSMLGAAIDPGSLVNLTIPIARRLPDVGLMVEAPILYSDRFGNLITSLLADDLDSLTAPDRALLPNGATWEIEAGLRRFAGIVTTYASAPLGTPLAYFGSSGRLEVAVRNGSARRDLGLEPGQSIRLRLVRPGTAPGEPDA